MRKGFKRIALFFIIAALIPCNLIYADMEDADENRASLVSEYGYIDPDLNLEWPESSSKMHKYSLLPASYDMRNQSYGDKIQIKNQDDTGLCWAFATMTAAEINYYHTYGADAPEMVFSPLHLGYFTYNRVSDPMNLTRLDKNILDDENYKMFGGNCAIAMNSLSGWTGFVQENRMPFEDRDKDSFSSRLAYDNAMTLKGLYMINPRDRDVIKTAIMEYGAVTTGIYMHDEIRMDSHIDENGVYNSEVLISNHQVVIIGWDDSKNAWLIQNSWSEDWGEAGCFYASYDDPSMDLMAALEVQPADTYEFNYFYDGTAGTGYETANTGCKYANMYQGYRDSDRDTYHCLEAVGITVYDTDVCEFTIDVYTACEQGRPTSGLKAASIEVTTDTAGFHTFELPQSVKLDDNQLFSIVVTCHQPTDIAIETTDDSIDGITFRAGTAEGQSFKTDTRGRFSDLNATNSSVRIKGFVNTEEYRNVDINRYAGATRYETAEAVSDAVKETQKIEKYETVIVASGNDYPDALSGGCLSKVNNNAPILLTTNSRDDKTIKYIENNVKPEGNVYILGGTGVVSQYLENSLKNKNYNVIRLAGATRYDTNLAILEEAGVTGEDILVCSGTGYADSLAASATGKPVLLVGDKLTDAQYEYLYNNYYYGKAYIIGGRGAVTLRVEDSIRPVTKELLRLEGENRYKTAALVAEEFFVEPETVVLCYGLNFPDGLSGGPLAMEIGAPILLTDGYKQNAKYAQAYAARILDLKEITVLGGEGIISDYTVDYISR